MTKSPKKDSKLAVVESTPETTIAPPIEVAPATKPLEPQFLGDWTVHDDAEAGTAKIAWASDEGIRRVEIPHWLLENIRGTGRP